MMNFVKGEVYGRDCEGLNEILAAGGVIGVITAGDIEGQINNLMTRKADVTAEQLAIHEEARTGLIRIIPEALNLACAVIIDISDDLITVSPVNHMPECPCCAKDAE